MIVYHGTTRRVARRIATHGFEPRSPSRRVWFAKSSGYAKQRARTKSLRTGDRPIVLTCDIDLAQLRQKYGSRQIRESGGVISINGAVPSTALRTHYGLGLPENPEEIARWINAVLGVKPHKGIHPQHPGVLRLVRWVNNKLATNPNAKIGEKELLSYASQWMPEQFAGVEVDFEHLRVWPKIAREERTKGRGSEYIPEPPEDHREEEALECLESDKVQRQVRGLKLLADLGDPDLFEWCVLLLGEDDPELQTGVLKVMRRCEDVESDVLAPFAESDEKAVRAAAIEVLGLRGGDEAHQWFWRGLTDPEPHVRLSAVKFLDRLDPQEHREIFETALYDPHPQVAQVARKLTEGMGYRKLVW